MGNCPRQHEQFCSCLFRIKRGELSRTRGVRDQAGHPAHQEQKYENQNQQVLMAARNMRRFDARALGM
jgi:hypothetical protein